MSSDSNKLAVIGAGTMGSAIVKRLIESGVRKGEDLEVTVRRDQHAALLSKQLGIPVHTDSQQAIERSSMVVLAMKPQEALPFVQQLKGKKSLADGKVFISIVSGITLEQLSAPLKEAKGVVRAMPNTPCLVGAGVTALAYADDFGDEQQRQLVHDLFGALGDVIDLPERYFDTVTGLSASGPAFAYTIIESLADGGVMCGLPRDVAVYLAARALLGSAAMVLETDRHPAELRDEVTTPAGCTIGALLHMEDGRIRSVLARGVQEAARIATTLGAKDRDPK